MSSDLKNIRDEILRVSQSVDSEHEYKQLLDSLLMAMFNLSLIAEHVEEGEPFKKADEELIENSFDSIVRATDKSYRDNSM